MKKVLVFGTFDVFHKGHEFFLRESKKYGDKLFVVIARNETVINVKGQEPKNNENKRKESVEKSGLADSVVVGYKGDKYKIIEEIKPDIICLGYDQVHFVDGLKDYLKNKKIKVIRIKSFNPEKYKSSLLNN